MITDMELVARVTSSDDQAAFQLLVERHQAAIRGFFAAPGGGRLRYGGRPGPGDIFNGLSENAYL